MSTPIWRKSSYSNGSGDCVEAARLAGRFGFRDSKNPENGTLRLFRKTSRAFLTGLKTK